MVADDMPCRPRLNPQLTVGIVVCRMEGFADGKESEGRVLGFAVFQQALQIVGRTGARKIVDRDGDLRLVTQAESNVIIRW